MTPDAGHADRRREQSGLSLTSLLIWLGIFGAVLLLLEQQVGWPRPLAPQWEAIQQALAGGLSAGIVVLVPLALNLAWAAWLLTALGLVLQVLINVLDALTRGARWVSRLRSAMAWLVLPPVRRAVDASLGGMMLARVLVQPAAVDAASNPLPVVAAASVQAASTSSLPAAAAVPLMVGSSVSADEDEAPLAAHASTDVLYTVRTGDTLSAIGLRFYGQAVEGAERIFEANQGRPQRDGRTFDRRGLIFPGWTLLIPEPTHGVETDEQGRRSYTVARGDTLWGISERHLGDGRRANEVFDANRGARAPDGHVLRNPNLIWPGLRLNLPGGAAPEARPSSEAVSEREPETTEPSPPVPTSRPAQLAVDLVAADRVQPEVPAREPATSSPEEKLVAPSAAIEPAAAPSELLIAEPPLARIDQSDTPTVPPAAAAALAAGTAAGAILAGRLVVRRRRPAPDARIPESTTSIANGFADADPTENLTRRLAHSSDPAAEVARLLGRAYAAVPAERLPADERRDILAGITLAATRHGRSSTTLVLSAPVAARPYLVRSMRAACERAFGEQVDVDGLVGHDGDVLVRVTWDPRRPVATDLLERAGDASGFEHSLWPEPMLVPGVMLRDHQALAFNWQALSHVLVAAPTGQGAEVPLTALVAGLASVRSPEDLGLVLVARPHTLPDELGQLPHALVDQVGPDSPEAVRNALDSVVHELERRRQSMRESEPELVVVIRELCDLDAEAQNLVATIAAMGPHCGVRLLAASERTSAELLRKCSYVDRLGTRLVLQAAEEEDSVALLGMPGAENLGAGGHALLRFEGRMPVQGWAYRVSGDRLSALLHMMGTRAANMPSAPPVVDAGSDDALVEPDSTSPEAAEDPPVAPAHVESESPFAPAEAVLARAADAARVTPRAAGWTSPLLDKLRAAPIRVSCFGAAEVRHGDEVLVLPNPELLLLLAVHPVGGIANEALADMLWGDEPKSGIAPALRKARHNLRTRLFQLVPELEADRAGYQLSGREGCRTGCGHRLERRPRVWRAAQGCRASGWADRYRALRSSTVPVRRRASGQPPRCAHLPLDVRRRPPGCAVPARGLSGPHRDARLRLASLLASGPASGLERAEELYLGLCAEEPENERLWTALFQIYERTGTVLGLDAAVRRLRDALAETRGVPSADVEHMPLPGSLERLIDQIRARIGANPSSSAAAD